MTNKSKGEIIIPSNYLEWNRMMYYMAIKLISAFNVKANFGTILYKNITSHCSTNIETKPFWFYILHGPMFFPMVLDLLFQGTYHYYWAWYWYNHVVTLVVYHYNYIYKNCVAHNKQWLLLQHILTSIFQFFKMPHLFLRIPKVFSILTLPCLIHLSKASWSSYPDKFALKSFLNLLQ